MEYRIILDFRFQDTNYRSVSTYQFGFKKSDSFCETAEIACKMKCTDVHNIFNIWKIVIGLN